MNLKDKINKMPECPGIYIMKDAYNNIIYVGKSINLKSRVKSYFRDNLNRSRKIERMVKSIKDIDYITTDTELDALLLECDYIHNIRPMYNTLMNNYEKYKYIKLNTNSLNLIDIVDEKDDDSIYFGPFSMNKRLFTLRDFLLNYFKLPTCNTKIKCIRYNIEKCIGPCRVNTKEKYEEIYKILENTFEGKVDFIKELENEMIKQSSLLNFEKAMEIKSNMDLLKSISEKENTFNLFKNNSKFVLWMKINENNYKLYFINNVKVKFSQIINIECFNDEMKSEIKNKIEEFKLRKNIKVVYDKSYIDYINIIYSYIYKNEKIDYIQL
ncbi:GIY-YIG nuclease family protein [Terrisporobacter glycolicus]|uniref:GIY-YIG nuclease family protein n=1 Tax=Terrisporobacter glycolicus TaxID=36841 RepID=UPI0034642E66